MRFFLIFFFFNVYFKKNPAERGGNGTRGEGGERENTLRSSLGLTEQNVFMRYEPIVLIRRIDHDNTFSRIRVFFQMIFFFFLLTCIVGGSTDRCTEPALHAGIQSIIIVH